MLRKQWWFSWNGEGCLGITCFSSAGVPSCVTRPQPAAEGWEETRMSCHSPGKDQTPERKPDMQTYLQEWL